MGESEDFDGIDPIPPSYLYHRETDFFGWTPISYIDEVIGIVNKYAHEALESLQEFIDGELGECMENEKLVGSWLESCVDKYFDKWELFCLQKVFRVKPEYAIPGQENYDWEATDEDHDALDNEITSLRESLLKARKTKALIIANNNKVMDQTRKLKQYHEAFHTLPEVAKSHEYSVKSLEEEAKFIVNQLQELLRQSNEGQKYEDNIEKLISMNMSVSRENSPSNIGASAVSEDAVFEELNKKIDIELLKNFKFSEN